MKRDKSVGHFFFCASDTRTAAAKAAAVAAKAAKNGNAFTAKDVGTGPAYSHFAPGECCIIQQRVPGGEHLQPYPETMDLGQLVSLAKHGKEELQKLLAHESDESHQVGNVYATRIPITK